MDKKQLLVALLEKLGQDWLPAQGLLVLVKDHELKEETLDALLKIITDAINRADNELMKEKLTKASTYLQKLQQLEEEEKENEEEELEALLATL